MRPALTFRCEHRPAHLTLSQCNLYRERSASVGDPKITPVVLHGATQRLANNVFCPRPKKGWCYGASEGKKGAVRRAAGFVAHYYPTDNGVWHRPICQASLGQASQYFVAGIGEAHRCSKCLERLRQERIVSLGSLGKMERIDALRDRADCRCRICVVMNPPKDKLAPAIREKQEPAKRWRGEHTKRRTIQERNRASARKSKETKRQLKERVLAREVAGTLTVPRKIKEKVRRRTKGEMLYPVICMHKDTRLAGDGGTIRVGKICGKVVETAAPGEPKWKSAEGDPLCEIHRF